MTVSVPRGRSRSRFFRLCVRAPRMRRRPAEGPVMGAVIGAMIGVAIGAFGSMGGRPVFILCSGIDATILAPREALDGGAQGAGRLGWPALYEDSRHGRQ